MSSNVQPAKGHQRLANGVVYALIVCAIALGATAGWMRSWQSSESGSSNGVQEMIGSLWPPDISLAAGWGAAEGRPQDAVAAPRCRSVCPQCQSSCWTRGRSGFLLCPFCGQGMVEQVRELVQAAATAAPGTASLIPIQAGVMPTHDNRGACTNCHTVIRTVGSGLAPMIEAGVERPHRHRGSCAACHAVVRANGLGPVPTIPVDAVAPHPERGACANCHIVAKLSAAAAATAATPATPAAAPTPAATTPNSPAAQWRGVAAPPITADAVKPILIKQFGIEVCAAAGEGAKVTGVMGNSYASKAGLAAGDIIIECNGKKVRDAEGLAQLVGQAPPEADALLKIVRSGRAEKVPVMVGEGEMEGFTPIQKP